MSALHIRAPLFDAMCPSALYSDWERVRVFRGKLPPPPAEADHGRNYQFLESVGSSAFSASRLPVFPVFLYSVVCDFGAVRVQSSTVQSSTVQSSTVQRFSRSKAPCLPVFPVFLYSVVCDFGAGRVQSSTVARPIRWAANRASHPSPSALVAPMSRFLLGRSSPGRSTLVRLQPDPLPPGAGQNGPTFLASLCE